MSHKYNTSPTTSKYNTDFYLQTCLLSLLGIKFDAIPGHILRNPEQGPIIKDIIAESEGEKIPRLTFC